MIEEKQEQEALELPEDEMLPAELDLLPLQTETKEVLNDIVKAKSNEELKGYLARFNLNMAKKNAVRIARMQNLLDAVDDQAIERMEKHPSEFSNKEIQEYMKTIQDQINSSQKAIDGLEEKPMIQITDKHSEVNINVESPALASREAKDRVMKAVEALTRQLVNKPEEPEEPKDSDNIDETLYNIEEDENNGQ